MYILHPPIVWYFHSILLTECIQCSPGNCIGDEGIEELKDALNTQGQMEKLGSLSDDEGDEDDDEDEDIDEICAQNESGEENDSEEETSNLSLKVEGISIKPQSPLLGDDEEIQQELQKVS